MRVAGWAECDACGRLDDESVIGRAPDGWDYCWRCATKAGWFDPDARLTRLRIRLAALGLRLGLHS